MNIDDLQRRLRWVPPGILTVAERYLKRIPRVRAMLEKEYEDMLGGLEDSLKPYRKEFKTFSRLPQVGRGQDEILRELEAIKAREESRWRDGFVSGRSEEHTSELQSPTKL